MTKKRSPLAALFLTVFIDLLGFGIVLPLLPQYAKDYDAGGAMIGLLMASFSAMQFLVAPIWGRLSDRIGRRPVIMIGLGGSVLSYTLFALAESPGVATALGFADPVPVLLISRIAAGLFGATIGSAQAFIADVTDEHERGRGMALIGAAFGIGFTVGPALGGLSDRFIGRSAPGFIAAALSLVALGVAWRTLVEPERHHGTPARGWAGLVALRSALASPTVPLIIGLQFLATFAFANLEGTLALLTKEKFGYDPGDNGWLFAYVGFALLVGQGVLVRRFMPRVGEINFTVLGTGVLVAGLAAVGAAATTWQALVALPIAVFGFSMVTPSLSSLLSRRTPEHMQGEVLGVGQSVLSLARILGPFIANVLFAMTWELPYWVGAGCMAIAFLGSLVLRRTATPSAGMSAAV